MKSPASFLFLLLLFIASGLHTLSGQILDTQAVLRKIDSLHDVSISLAFAGSIDEALTVNAEVEKIVLAQFGRTTAAYGKYCSKKGEIYVYSGDNNKAEQFILEALDIYETNIGKNHADYAESLNVLANVYWYKGLYEKVVSVLLECKDIQEITLGKEHPMYSTTLANLGAVYTQINQYEKSEEYLLESRNMRERIYGKNHLYAKIQFDLGLLYSVMGQYKRAELSMLECKEIQENTLGKEHPEYAYTLREVGGLYQEMGQYEKAEGYFLDCLEVQEKTLGKEHPHYAITLNNLAGLYHNIGQFEKAKQTYLQALDIFEKTWGKVTQNYAAVLTNLGTLHLYVGQFDIAEKYFLEGKDIFETMGREDSDYAKFLIQFGKLHNRNGQYEKAEVYLLDSKNILEKTLGTEHPRYALNLNDLGILYKNLGQYEKAEGYLLDSKNIYERILGKEHPYYVSSNFNLVRLYEKMGQYEKVEPLIDTATRTSHLNLRKAVQFLSEKNLGDYLNGINLNLRTIPYYLHTGQFSGRMASLAYDDALFQKGFLQTAARRLNTLTAGNPEADSLSQLLSSYRHRLSAEYTKPIQARSADLAALEERANTLENRLARVVAGYAEVLRQVQWQEVQAALKPGEAAIEFLQFRVLLPEKTDTVRYAALLLRPGMEAPLHVDLCDERDIDTLMVRNADRKEEYVKRLYAATDRGLTPVKEQLRSLYELLWSPLEPHLQGIHTVSFANAGLLHRINLGAINIGIDTVLADRYKLVELGSTRSLVVPDGIPPANRQALVMGGIQYDSDSTALSTAIFAVDSMSYALRSAVRFNRSTSDSMVVEYWPALPFSAREADNIGATLRKSSIPSLVLKGYEATEEAFYKSVRLEGTSPRIIHLATHGYFQPDPKLSDDEQNASTFRLSEHPLIRSGLILAGGNHAWRTGKPIKPDLEDGILTAYEISRLNLSGTELVVLSACETGLGDIQGNEGVYGLQRAFKIAGVRYVIMSLWQVPDRQTSLFMNSFYQRWLDQGMSIPEAFRQTQLEMRQNGWSHHQWAGFVLLE